MESKELLDMTVSSRTMVALVAVLGMGSFGGCGDKTSAEPVDRPTGYEFAKRLGLPMAALYNKAGQPVAPTPESGQAGQAAVLEVPADLRAFIPDPDGPNAYPIVTYTWILLNARYSDTAKVVALKDVLSWGLRDGQTIAPELGYIPLPRSMIAKATEALDHVQ